MSDARLPTNRRNPRRTKARLQRELYRSLSRGLMGTGVAGFCGGCSNAQLRAAAKQQAHKLTGQYSEDQLRYFLGRVTQVLG